MTRKERQHERGINTARRLLGKYGKRGRLMSVFFGSKGRFVAYRPDDPVSESYFEETPWRLVGVYNVHTITLEAISEDIAVFLEERDELKALGEIA